MTTATLKLITTTAQTARAAQATRRTGLRRTLTQTLELAGVLALMGSSAAYALYALAHLA